MEAKLSVFDVCMLSWYPASAGKPVSHYHHVAASASCLPEDVDDAVDTHAESMQCSNFELSQQVAVQLLVPVRSAQSCPHQ